MGSVLYFSSIRLVEMNCLSEKGFVSVLKGVGKLLRKRERIRKRGSSVVSALASGARGPTFDPRSRRGKFRSPTTLSLVSFAGMTLDRVRGNTPNHPKTPQTTTKPPQTTSKPPKPPLNHPKPLS